MLTHQPMVFKKPGIESITCKTPKPQLLYLIIRTKQLVMDPLAVRIKSTWAMDKGSFRIFIERTYLGRGWRWVPTMFLRFWFYKKMRWWVVWKKRKIQQKDKPQKRVLEALTLRELRNFWKNLDHHWNFSKPSAKYLI